MVFLFIFCFLSPSSSLSDEEGGFLFIFFSLSYEEGGVFKYDCTKKKCY